MWTIFTQYFADAATCAKTSFFGMPTWYHYLGNNLDADCSLKTIEAAQVPDVVILIALALIDIMLRIAGMVAVGFIIYGGIKYLTSNGDSSQSKLAQESIINSLIGLTIAIVAAALVSFVGRTLQ